MKVYYDSTGNGVPDTQITGIVDYPDTSEAMDTPGSCMVTIRDFEVGLYATWSVKDFTKVNVTDDDGNQIFIGYLINKKFTYNKLQLFLVGFSQKLVWNPFSNNYNLEQGQLGGAAPWSVPDGETIDCFLDANDLNGEYDAGEAYNWAVDQWIKDQQDKAIVIESPAGLNNEIWKCTTLDFDNDANMLETSGDEESTQDYLDLDRAWFLAEPDGDYPQDIILTVTPDWDDEEDSIPITKFLKQINIHYRIYVWIKNIHTEHIYAYFYLYNYTTEAYDLILERIRIINNGFYYRDTVGGKDESGALLELNPKVLIDSATVDLTDYLNDSDADDEYDQMKFKFELEDNGYNDSTYIYLFVDYLSVEIEYHADDVGAIMLPIIDNAASTITAEGADWDNLGVAEKDGFKIGENSRQIIADIMSAAGLRFDLIDGYTNSTTRTQEPSSNGTDVEWTPDNNHWDDVSDDNDATDVQTGTNSEVEEYAFDSFHLAGGRYVSQTVVRLRAKYAGSAQALTVAISWDSGASWSDPQSTGSLTAAYANYDLTFSSLEIWDQDEVDGFQVQIQAPVDIQATGSTVYVCEVDVTHTIKIPNFNKYDARDFKGSFCIDALRKVMKLEGAHWAEDHENESIKIVKPDDFEDNGVDLDRTDYDWDWEFEDKCNSIGAVHVYGNAALRIEAINTGGDANSPIHRQIIDEGINAYGIAAKMAEAEIGLYSSKQPSLRLSLHGVYTALKPATDVHITFEKPDGTVVVAQALYPIRKINRSRQSISEIKTIIWAGLGRSSEEEKVAEKIINAAFSAHDAHQARLISTPAGTGANISWNDIGGANAGAIAAINAALDGDVTGTIAETVVGNDSHTHDTRYYTEDEIEAFLAIGSANAQEMNFVFEGSDPINQMYNLSGIFQANAGATDAWAGYIFPLPLKMGPLNLYIKDIIIGIKDADNVGPDEIDRVILTGWDDHTGNTSICDTGAGENINTVQEWSWDTSGSNWDGPYQIGGNYRKLNLRYKTEVTTLDDLDVVFVIGEYYYA